MSFRKCKKILLANGWVYVRTKGSHNLFKNAMGRTLCIPCHPGKDVNRMIIQNIERSTGLKLL